MTRPAALDRHAQWPTGIPLPASLRTGFHRGRLLRRSAILSAFLILTAYAVVAVAAVLGNWHFYDAEGYMQTGMRLRDGQPLYPALASQDAPEVFRYAPWFAWAWWGLSYLPHQAVMMGWLVILGSAAAYTVWLIPRSLGGSLIILVLAPMLFRAMSQGNVQPLIVAMLAFGLTRRSGPFWIGVAASMKFVPLLLASVYMSNREYRRAAVAVAVTVVLWLPALAYGVEHYPTTVGGESFAFGWWTYGIMGIALLAVFVLPKRYRMLAACIATAFASPRWIPYNPTYIAPAASRAHPRTAATGRAPV